MTDTPARLPATPEILIVDDEPMVIQSLASLLQLETDYAVSTFESPREALARLEERPSDVIVSDFMMPGMNGLEFLREARRLHPDTPRILLTGYADKENAIRAINEVGLYQYIEKPWDNEQLKVVLRNGIEHRTLQTVLKQHIHELERTTRRADRLHEEASQLQDELDQARRLLQELLPDELSLPQPLELFRHFEPALPIGGDFYDILKLADGRPVLLLADLTGHGIKAALSIALLKFAFAAFAGREADAADIVRGINRVLHDGLPSGVFAAAVVVVIDIDSDQYHIANAGTPHPLIVRRDAGKIERVAAEGLLLGVTDPDHYPDVEISSVSMKPGDGLLLMTDGITEAETDEGRQFGEGALQAVLRDHMKATGNDLIKSVTQALADQRSNGDEKDDVTLLLVENMPNRSTP